MCKKQTSVSHSSTELEIISLDAGLRLDGIPALDLWDLIVFSPWKHGSDHDTPEKPVVCRDASDAQSHQSRGKFNVLNNVDRVPSNVQFSHQGALLYVFEDSEAVIKMIIKGRSPTLRLVSRTHRVALDWLFDRIKLDTKIQIKYIEAVTDREDSKSTFGGTLCVFGSHTFVPISWMCKKQTSVSHSSTESEIISLEAALRMDGITALDLWDLIVTVLHGDTNQSKLVPRNLSTSQTRKQIPGKIDDLNNVDFVSSNANSSHQEAMLYNFEDNEAVIKMIMKGRSPTMRHVPRTH